MLRTQKKYYSILTSYPRIYLQTHPLILRTFEIFYDFGGCIDILVTCRFIVYMQCCKTSSTNYMLKGLTTQIILLCQICLDNAREFTSQKFDDYCIGIKVNILYPMCVYTKMVLEIGYAHQLSTWGYAISHAALLIRFQTHYQSTVLCVPDGNWI